MKLKLSCPELSISEEKYDCLGVITVEKSCVKKTENNGCCCTRCV